MGIQRRESSEKEDFVGVWTLLWFSCVLMNVKYVRWFSYPANGLGSPIWQRAIFLFFFFLDGCMANACVLDNKLWFPWGSSFCFLKVLLRVSYLL